VSAKKIREDNVTLLLVLLVTVLAVVASGIFYFRIDMTADRSFSLSKVSRGLYKQIDEQVRITYFISDRLMKEQSNPKRIEDLLRSYAATSRGRISVDVVDPDSSNQAQAMQEYGIPAQQYQVIEKNQESVANVYTGILIQYVDRFEVIPVAWDPSVLEYEVTRSILKAVKGTKSVVEVLVGDADKTWANNYKIMASALQQGGWTVRECQAGEEIGNDVELLIVLGNSKLDDFDLYPVDQYLMRGGRALFAVKGVDVMTSYMYAMPVANDSVLNMLKGYGADIKKELLLDKSCITSPFQIQDQNGQVGYSIVSYPYWVVVNEKYLSKSSQLTSKFAGLDLMWPSPLELVAVPGVNGEMIASSTPKAWKSTKNFDISPQNQAAFYMEATTTAGQYGLAATLEGKLPSYFKGKKIPTREGQKTAWKEPVDAQAAARIVVIPSSDFLADILINYTKSDFNVTFATSCADWLGSDSNLLSIKTRSYRDDRLNKIEDPDTQNTLIFLTYLICMGLVPLGVAGFGVFRFIRRKNRAKQGMSKEALNEVSN
jgi:ABC-2 type transport system permease protein